MWKFHAGALRISAFVRGRVILRHTARQSFERWRDFSLGTFELVPRHTFMQTVREKQGRISELEVRTLLP